MPAIRPERTHQETLGGYTLSIVRPDSFRFSSILRCCNNGQHGFDRFLPGYQRWRTQGFSSERARQRTGHLRCRERGRRRHACHSQTWVARKVPCRVAPETIEKLQRQLSRPSVKLQLAAIRMLFDWLVVGQVVAFNPASSVRGPRFSTKKGKTPVLSADEARQLLDSMDTSSVVGLRDRALVALMVYTFARV